MPRGDMDEGEHLLRNVRRQVEVDSHDLVRRAVERGEELPREDAQILVAQSRGDAALLNEVGERAVALHQRLGDDMVGEAHVGDPPPAAAVNIPPCGLADVPVPDELLHLGAAEAVGGRAPVRREAVRHLQVEAARGKLHSLAVIARTEVAPDLHEGLVIGIHLVRVGGVELAMPPHDLRDEPGLGELRAVGLGEQDLQDCLVRRVDALVDEPERRAEELLCGDGVARSEVKPVAAVAPELRHDVSGAAVVAVDGVILVRHQVPDQPPSGYMERRAVELVKEEEPLRAAAVLARERR